MHTIGARFPPRLPFAQNPTLSVLVCNRVCEGSPVLDVYHDELFDWQFLCGGEEHVGVDAAKMMHLHHLSDGDTSLCELESLPLHHRAHRDRAESPWTAEPIVRDPEDIGHRDDPHCPHCLEMREGVARDADGYLPSERMVLDNIARTGLHIAQIIPEPSHDGWSFSIGLYQNYRHPEVVVFGQKPEWQSALINAIADEIKDGVVYEPAKRYRGLIPPDYEVEFRAINYPDWYHELVGNAIWYYGNVKRTSAPFPLLQVVWPDVDRTWPWELGYDSYVQPIVAEA